MAAHRFVAVVGSRKLPPAWAAQVTDVVRFFLARGWGIGSGGARGADQYALDAVLGAGAAACRRSVVFVPGAHSGAPGGALRAFVARGGRVVPGSGVGRAALLARSRRLARASSGVVAFLWGPSRGSVFTMREAIGAGLPAAVVVAGGAPRCRRSRVGSGSRARSPASRRFGGCRMPARLDPTTPSRSAARSIGSSSCRTGSRRSR